MTKTSDRMDRLAKMEARIAALPSLNERLIERVSMAHMHIAAARFSEKRGHVTKAAASEEAAYRLIGFVFEEVARDPVGSAARRKIGMTYWTKPAIS